MQTQQQQIKRIQHSLRSPPLGPLTQTESLVRQALAAKNSMDRYHIFSRIRNEKMRNYWLYHYALNKQEEALLDGVMAFFKTKADAFDSREFKKRFLTVRDSFLGYYGSRTNLGNGALDERHSCGMFYRLFGIFIQMHPLSSGSDEDVTRNIWWIEYAQGIGKRVVVNVSIFSKLCAQLTKIFSGGGAAAAAGGGGGAAAAAGGGGGGAAAAGGVADKVNKFFYCATSPDGFCFFNAYRDYLNLPNYGKTPLGIQTLRQDILEALNRYFDVEDELYTDTSGTFTKDDPENNKRLVDQMINPDTATLEVNLAKLIPYMSGNLNYVIISDHDPLINHLFDKDKETLIIYADGIHFTRIECDNKRIKQELIRHLQKTAQIQHITRSFTAMFRKAHQADQFMKKIQDQERKRKLQQARIGRRVRVDAPYFSPSLYALQTGQPQPVHEDLDFVAAVAASQAQAARLERDAHHKGEGKPDYDQDI